MLPTITLDQVLVASSLGLAGEVLSSSLIGFPTMRLHSALKFW